MSATEATAFLFCSLLFLSARFLFFREDTALSGIRLALASLPGFGLLIFPNVAVLQGVCLAILLAVVHFVVWIVERRSRQVAVGCRCLTLPAGFALSLLFSAGFARSWAMHSGSMSVPAFLVFACAALLCMKEANYLIRWYFRHHRLVEKIEDSGVADTGNGRLIGSLERLLLLIFLWEGAALAATFIVAVKGLARFKKMEESQAFAEYVIIGTFLSVLVTVVVYRAAKAFLASD